MWHAVDFETDEKISDKSDTSLVKHTDSVRPIFGSYNGILLYFVETQFWVRVMAK